MRSIDTQLPPHALAQILYLDQLARFSFFALDTDLDRRAPQVIRQSFLRGFGSIGESAGDTVEGQVDWTFPHYSSLVAHLNARESLVVSALNLLVPREDEMRERIELVTTLCCEWLEEQRGVADVVYVVFSRSPLWSTTIQDRLEDDLEAFVVDATRVSYGERHTCFVLLSREMVVAIPHVLGG